MHDPFRRLVSPQAVLGLAALMLVVSASAFARPASDATRAFERKGRARAISTSRLTRSVPLAHANGVSLVVVNAAWVGQLNGASVNVGTHAYTIGTDAFAAIQDGIDAVDPNGTVDVLPGAYTETAANRFLFDSSGPYQFGLFFGASKGALHVQGVDTSGNPITSSAGVLATVTTNGTADFGPDGVWVEGDGVTIAGIGIGTNLPGQNKTIEVIGDAFTIKWCDLADTEGSVYFDDWRFDTGTNTSHVQSYRIEGNNFQHGLSVDIASGAGFSGPASGRVITGNAFHNAAGEYWPMVSFNGSDTGVPWFVYSVGGAQITGNTFANLEPQGQDIRARGTYDNSQFDWASYFTANSFDRATAVGPAPPTNLREFSVPNGYGVSMHSRRIAADFQTEVDNGVDGDLVLAKAGTYVEQVVVNGKNVSLQGAGRALTTIQAPPSLTASFTTSGVNLPVVFVQNASNVSVSALTIDGAGAGASNYRLQGAAWWNAGGKLLSCDIVRVRDEPFSGNQSGVALYAGTNTGGPYALEVGDSHLSDFQKNGTVFTGSGYAVNMHDCTVTGQGMTSLNAENGVEVVGGATAQVDRCTISGLFYTGPTYTACGQLFDGAGTVNVSDGAITGCQTGTYYIDGAGTMLNTATHTPSGSGAYGVAAYNSSATLAANAVRRANAQATPHPLARPMDAVMPTGTTASQRTRALDTSLNLTLDGGCITGPGTPASEGIDVYSEGGGLSVSARHLEISGWDYGIVVDGSGGSAMNADHDAITGNLTAGYYGGVGSNVAQLDWWGNAGGPGAGGSNPVAGTVSFSPWLTSGADTNPGCGFAPAADNVIAPAPASACVTATNTCVDVPVTITRTTSDNIRGFSVTVQLAGGLTLCSASEGGYLNSVSATQFEVTPLGGGAYTIDCAILGLPCGATAPSGTLFTLHVGSALGSGTGTVSVSSVILRDCSNGAVAASIGGSVPVTIDNAGPAALTSLAAAQVKTGNTSPVAPGTTAITVSWPATPAGTSVRIYRKGYGHYPEYDDGGGSVPVAPGSYPPPGWTLAGVAASGTSFVDKPPVRDFWYYVAYVQDACGAVSPVSSRMNGTLDYHLGDVDPVLAGTHVGDDHVDLADVSDLGFHYGITLAPNDPLDYLDVGPTTDFSVDARPTTDHHVQFEDLILFAINYGVVSAPQFAAGPALPAGVDAVGLTVPNLPAVGQTFDVGVTLQSRGDVKGVSLDLAYDPAIVEPVGVEPGALLAAQHAPSLALTAQAGNVDVALLGTGLAISGEGELALATFRVKASGAPAISIGHVLARDVNNHPVALGTAASQTPAQGALTTGLGAIYPNPVRDGATIELSLKQAGRVALDVFDLSGRHVSQVLQGLQPAGMRLVRWTGHTDDGHRLPAGVYMVRLQAGGVSQTRRVMLLP